MDLRYICQAHFLGPRTHCVRWGHSPPRKWRFCVSNPQPKHAIANCCCPLANRKQAISPDTESLWLLVIYIILLYCVQLFFFVFVFLVFWWYYDVVIFFYTLHFVADKLAIYCSATWGWVRIVVTGLCCILSVIQSLVSKHWSTSSAYPMVIMCWGWKWHSDWLRLKQN